MFLNMRSEQRELDSAYDDFWNEIVKEIDLEIGYKE